VVGWNRIANGAFGAKSSEAYQGELYGLSRLPFPPLTRESAEERMRGADINGDRGRANENLGSLKSAHDWLPVEHN